VVLIDGGKKSAAKNEKLPLRFIKSLADLKHLFLAISCQTPECLNGTPVLSPGQAKTREL
jgi:hypothetical protein